MRKSAILLIILTVIIIFSISWFFFPFHPVGPGLPPPDGLAEWYIPGRGSDVTADMFSGIDSEYRFIVIGDPNWGGVIHHGEPPFFPPTNGYGTFIDYYNPSRSAHYTIETWYFDDRVAFSEFEGKLAFYLENLSYNGSAGQAELNLSEEFRMFQGTEMNIQPTFIATTFKSPYTSGYFIVYEKPFSLQRDDYFIVYYGSVGSGTLESQTSALKELIASSYFTNTGIIRGLVGV